MMFDIFFYQGMFGRGNALDRLDLFSITFDSQRHARKDRPAVEDYGTGTTGAAIAHQFCSRQSKLVVDKVMKRPIRVNLKLVFLAVDREMNGPFRIRRRFRPMDG
jgi:hypothetical protein